MARSDASFPEPLAWNGQDDQPMPSSSGHETWRQVHIKAIRRTLQHFVQTYGAESLRRILLDVFPEDAELAKWVDAQEHRRSQ